MPGALEPVTAKLYDPLLKYNRSHFPSLLGPIPAPSTLDVERIEDEPENVIVDIPAHSMAGESRSANNEIESSRISSTLNAQKLFLSHQLMRRGEPRALRKTY
jgi:hypothetical protein